MREEVWKDIIGYEGLYQISNFGRVKSFIGRGRILKPSTTPQGYLKVCLRPDKRQFTIHRLVASHFITNLLNKPQINHKNMVRDDNNVDNLEWVDNRENVIHRSRKKGRLLPTGVYHASENSYQATLYEKKKKHYLGSFDTPEKAGEAYNQALIKINNAL